MMADKATVMFGNRFPIYKATTTPQRAIVLYGPYVIHSGIQGFVPAIDIQVDVIGPGYTMICNQMSVGKALLAKFIERRDSLSGVQFNISRVAEGRMAPYKIEVL